MLVLVHLTDIHIHSDIDPILARSDVIGAAIASHMASAAAVMIVLTGDIANSGEAVQYDLALTFLKRIEERVARDFEGEIRFSVTPGNHDCDFSQEQDLRNLVLKQIAEKAGAEITPQYVATCVEVQRNFFEFLKQLTTRAPVGMEKLRYLDAMVVDGKIVSFDCLNLSWVSQLREDKITFPSAIIPSQRDVNGCVITLMHHPFNWLHPSAYRDFRRRVRANSDFIFSGHEHQWNIVETQELEAGSCVQFEGNVLQESRSNTSGFAIVELDLEVEKYRSFSYQWNGNEYERQDLEEWSDYRSFHLVPPVGAWVFTKEFDSDLSDLGVILRVGGKDQVYLEDVFVFPDLEASSDESDDATTIHGESLIRDSGSKNGFVIEGDDRSGRSTLLKHLVRKYSDLGKVPLLVPSSRFTRATEEGINSALDDLVREQYGRKLDQFLQIQKSDRVLLIDDFDEVPIKSEKARSQLLCRLRDRCGVLILAVSDFFEAAHLIDTDENKIYEGLPKYRILPFGRLSRAKLISRWVTIDSDEFLDGEERIRRIDTATKYVDTVMRWKVVPPHPIYLLTLLQAQKSGSPESFKDSGLGYYYQYLISDAMLEAGITKDELTEIDQYCTQLAWALKKLDRTYISLDELSDFNESFSAKWVKLDFEKVRRQLLRSRIIAITGDIAEFRYSYIYYFFVAKYLADNFDEEEVQGFVLTAAHHLYVRSNANILVFLTHFSTKTVVVERILETLNSQFTGKPLAQFALRNESVEAMLRQLPSVVYSGGDPEANREAAAERSDAVSRDSSDGLMDAPAETDSLSLSAQMTVVFKAVEILGQILKTQYSRIERDRRETIIRDMMNGPLRSLEVFYESLRENPDALVTEFEGRLAEEGEGLSVEARKALAQRVVGSMVLIITFGFIRRVSESIGAEVISDDLRAVVQQDGHLGQMLIRLAAILDGQRPLPRVEIEKIRKEGAGSLIVDRVVQVLVVYHMYMFRTSYADIRWAHDVLGIPDSVKIRTMLTGSPMLNLRGPN